MNVEAIVAAALMAIAAEMNHQGGGYYPVPIKPHPAARAYDYAPRRPGLPRERERAWIRQQMDSFCAR